MPDLSWFRDALYGMFIHWGPYAVAGRGEWVANRECIPFDEYRARYAANFRAEAYDPRRWAALARAAGMRYMVLTCRHHDGFCLWETATTGFCATRLGPERDLVRPFVAACREAGLKVGFYFSVADWYHPDYPNAFARDWPKTWRDQPSRQRFVAFYRAQLEELMTRYGPIDILWYDGCIPQPTDGGETNLRIRQLQPDILINERNGEPFDFRCSEQSLKAKEGPWEACMTLNNNWGFHAGDHAWKSPQDVVRMLITTSSKGGNLLLNVGPRADGTIPEESARIITEAGRWIARHRATLLSNTPSPFTWNNCSIVTTSGRTVYAHLVNWPGTEYCLAEIKNPVRSVRLADTGRPLEFEKIGPRLLVRGLPTPPDPIATTLAIDVEGDPEPNRQQETFWVPD